MARMVPAESVDWVWVMRPDGFGAAECRSTPTGDALVMIVFEVDGLDRQVAFALEPDQAAQLAMIARDEAERVWQARDGKAHT